MASSSANASVNAPVTASSEEVKNVIPTKRNPEIWQHFDLCEMMDGGKKARCKYCSKFYKHDANSTLKHHVDKPHCRVLQSQARSGQASMASDSATMFAYNVEKVREEMATFVIQKSLPFNHFDDQLYTGMVQRTLQPRYTHVSRSTLRRDCLKMWKKAKKETIDFFETLETGVSLTSDVWSAPHGSPESYICVTAHWIQPKSWVMMKRTIAFLLFDFPHTGENIYHIIDRVIKTFKLQDKIFSISFDNASNNTVAVQYLKAKYKPILDGIFFHSRCVAHIINLAVQDGLKVVESQKDSFKRMMRDIYSNTQRHARYKKYCKEANIPYLRASWDVAHRWNSTCTMFESALQQKESLIGFHDILVARGKVASYHRRHWDFIENLSQMLQVFKSSTTALSGVYYPTSSLTLQKLYMMCLKLTELENKGRPYSDMVDQMRQKFTKYFKEIPSVFTCVAALNPCFNLMGTGSLIEKIANELKLNTIDDPYFGENARTRFNNQFSEMFDVYLQKYGTTASNIQDSFRDAAFGEGSSTDPDLYVYNQLYVESSQAQRGNTTSSEFGRYTGTNFLQTMTAQDFKNFDLLAWWRSKEDQFPILATMARDLLTVQASTVASESAFSTSGRVITIRRTRLSSESIEMCICLKDYLDAAARVQDKSSLEGELEYEGQLYEEEVEEGYTTAMTDEEAAYDEYLRNSSGGEGEEW